MSTRGTQLISRLVRTGEIDKVIEWGITADDFPVHEDQAMWNMLFGYWTNPATRGSVFGPEKVREVFPTLTLCDDPYMSTEALCNEVRTQRIRMENEAVAKQMLQMNAHDPIGASQLLLRGGENGIRLATRGSTDLDFSAAMKRILHRYDQEKAGVDFSVGRWLWEPLQEEAKGIQVDDYVVFYGRPKSKKSWVLAAQIASTFLQGKPAIIYTKEMTPENIFKRVAAILAGVPYKNLRHATLSPEDEYKLRYVSHVIDQARTTQQFICLSGADAASSGGSDTVPWLATKVKQYRPSVVFVDGLYLMSDIHKAKKDNERVRNISREMRQMILSHSTPVIATMQATRAAAQHQRGELDEIAFSDALSQDCTLAIRTINDKRLTPDAEDTITLKVAGSREIQLDGFRIYGVPATNFLFKEKLSMAEILEAENMDQGSQKGKKTRRQDVDASPVHARIDQMNLR